MQLKGVLIAYLNIHFLHLKGLILQKTKTFARELGRNQCSFVVVVLANHSKRLIYEILHILNVFTFVCERYVLMQ